MKTYVLLHFEHKNDVTIIVKLLYGVTNHFGHSLGFGLLGPLRNFDHLGHLEKFEPF